MTNEELIELASVGWDALTHGEFPAYIAEDGVLTVEHDDLPMVMEALKLIAEARGTEGQSQ